MKICIFIETYYPMMGGGESQAQLLAEGLITHGHSVTVLTRRSDASLKNHERYGEVDVYRLAPVGAGQLKKWGLVFSSIPALFRLRDQFDLIFVSGYRIVGLTAVLIAKCLRKPVVLKADSQGEMSGDFFENGLKKFGISHKSFWFQWFLRIRNSVLKRADAFSAVSSEIASEWISSGIPSEKIHLIPNGVNMKQFSPVEPAEKLALRKKLKLAEDATIAIYTGRLVSYKGLLMLVKVWNDIRRKHENLLLVLAGTGGLDIHNCEEELREYVKFNGLEKDILFTGAVKNVPDYLQASDLFVFPTENEAFGASLLEAMACGLPVISTPVGAIKVMISNGENGFLIEPANALQLFEALDVMFSNREHAARLGQAARKSVEDRYAIETVTQKMIWLFEGLRSPR